VPSLLTIYWKTLLLDSELFVTLKSVRNGFWSAIELFLVVGLLTTLGMLAPIRVMVQRPTLAERTNQLAAQVDSFASGYPKLLAAPIQEVAASISNLARKFTEYQPPLGVRPSRVIRLIGEWLAAPLNLLGVWMGSLLGIWVVARLLGGQGSLREHLSLLLLAFAPQILTFLNYIPSQNSTLSTVGRMLSVIAILWSLLIATQALVAAHRLKQNQAILVLVIYFIAVFLAVPALLVVLSGFALAIFR